ncbi:PREDICTED: E3 ubiquitin-protein ligase TRIM71-like [Branchiostoma belcheri]|uniref:E3 ubiquitin-protein ligase TRIM71-like n=1 Tax=Branchiostoma belcheri TaxID=7741 RepID=A0A6P4XS68_BRABE|nr:PREDICTED: E3 ubiquitin-protein ligase TRIM71-like [Branchiostoma belcheri]
MATFRTHYYNKTFGEWGSGIGQFDVPCGVTVSEGFSGEIFVADKMNQRIQVFTLQGSFVRQFPTVVSGELEMKPYDVALDGEGNLWVVGQTGKLWVVGDTESESSESEFAVQYNKQGSVLRKIHLQKTGYDRGVAVDTRRNHILITQTIIAYNPHGEVQVFRPNGTLVTTVYVGQQQGMNQFSFIQNHPHYITVDGEGNILVSDLDISCVSVYNKEKNGQFLFQFGGRGSGEGQLMQPRGICTDGAGNIIVADKGNSRVEMFDKTGKFLKHIATDMKGPQAVAMATQGQLGTFVRQFPTVVSGEQKIYPHDVVIDREGNLWTVGWTDSADHDEFAVQYNKQGSLLRKISLQNTIRMSRRALAVDTWWNHIFITQITEDSRGNPHGEVLVFRTNGTLVRTMGLERGPKIPGHITVDGDGLLLASGISDDQVYVYNYMFGDPDDFLFRFGGSETWNGDDLRLLNVPCGICVAGAHIIVADRGNGSVEMFTLAGARFVKHIATDMKAPWSVALATQGHQLVVTDYYDDKITIFPESVWLWS